LKTRDLSVMQTGGGGTVARFVCGYMVCDPLLCSPIFSSLPPTIGNIKAGTLRALGTCALSRTPMLPDVPTMEEAGLKGFEAEQRYGLIAPAGTPDAVLRKLNQALRQALNADDVKERIAADGAVANPSTPEEYALDIDREEAKWARVVRLAKAR